MNGVDLDSLFCPLVAEGFRKLHHAAFRGSIGGDVLATDERDDGGDVDDLSGATLFVAVYGQFR